MSTKRNVIFLCFLAILLPVAGCAELTHTPSREAAHTGSRGIGGLLEPIRQKYDLPAMAAAVIVDGDTIVWDATGVRKAGSDVKVTPNDKFHIGSCTKAMTATLIATLVEQDKLRWDITLSEALPDMTDEMHPVYRNVTLRHLLDHRGGMPSKYQSWPEGKSFTNMYNLEGSAMEQRLTYARMILREEPEAMPGTEYIYSNAGYSIAGVIAEQSMKEPWENLMRTMLFEPLGMSTAGFGAMGTPGRIDEPWQHMIKDNELVSVEPGRLSDNPPVLGPGGTVHCSIRDWAKFVVEHLKGERGTGDLLKSETFKLLHTPGFGGDYASGWVVTEQDWGGGKVLTHAGSNNMSFAVAWMAPMRGFAVLVTSNQDGGDVAKACDETCWMLIREFLLSKEVVKGR
ncbi:MAG: serine hydrolase [Phycisphaerae bacterium]|nr:beta-lactamase family protein [Phycisphaerae bacterium]NIP51889.1 beta-lactamase family protein [Phycisphaerae bacterium]NIS49890.1 beta-lactamase family protein [Phycisphaerae bacterium]NIU08795.1 beta-lactamase family protein [Phycisphaerae bacterium]NIU56405.1 serine hydrolase [Phycisphaerae bacterium]